MAKMNARRTKVLQELLFQLLLHVVVFIFYAVSRRNPQIEEYEVVFYLNPVLMALVVNYVLLPRFFYPRKYLLFAVSLLGLIALSLCLEEFVLEQIYFPTTRGSRYGGVFYTLLSILPVAVIIVGFKFAWDAFRKQRQVETLTAAVRDSELQFLKSQINPHFLFNNLNNLYAHAIEQSPKTPEIILELSSVLRYMLYDCKADTVPLGREIEQLENYVGISELQIGERGEVKCEVNIERKDFQIAPLLLIVFVENAFKHTTASQSGDIRIHIRVAVNEKGEMYFECENSYDPQSNVEQLSRGIGLENVKKRLELLYPGTHELVIDPQPNAYKVSLKLNLAPLPAK